jgi:hypothetical protein
VDSSRCSSLILSIVLYLLPQPLLLHNARRQPRRRDVDAGESNADRAAVGCTP